MIVKLKKISLKGPKADFPFVVDALKSTGVFEQSNFKRLNRELTEKDFARRDEMTTQIARLKSALEYVAKCENDFVLAMKQHKKDKNKITENEQVVATYTEKRRASLFDEEEVDYCELKDVKKKSSEAMDIVSQLESFSTRGYEIANLKKRNAAMIKDLAPYVNLDIAFNLLKDTKNVFIVAGLIQKQELERFLDNSDLENIIIETYEADYGRVCAVCIGLHAEYPILNSIFDYGFERCKFNYNVTAKEKIEEHRHQNILLHYENLQVLHDSLKSAEEIKLLKMYYDYLNNELDTEDVLDNTLQTDKHFILNGWIVAKDQESIDQLIKQTSPQTAVKFDDVNAADSTPTLVKNNKLVAPYASITNLYSSPSQKDIDPNPFVAFFYFLFFGLMIGDIGYGLIMFTVTLVVLLKFKPKGKGTRDLFALVCMGGVSAMIWGLLFGSVFGFTASDSTALAILPRVFDPINDSLIFMGFCLGLGVLHIVFGLCLKFYNLARQKRILDAICDAGFRITLFIGIIMFVGGMLLPALVSIQMIGVWIAVGSLVLMVLTGGRNSKSIFGKVFGGFSSIISLVNYLSDVLSYARLFGLGLVGAVIAMVANIMGGMLFGLGFIGVIFGIIIALVFHMFNLGIGLLSAYVHNARLQFIEFFGKFYEGGGRDFTPLGSGLKYVRIKPILNKKGGE